MAKKAKHPEHENLERWLVSYADFMTLLFATFTALYALAQTDIAQLKDVSAAIREGFEEQSIMHGIKTVLQGKSPPNRNPDPLSNEKGAGDGVIGKFESMTYKPGEVKSIKKLADELSKDLEALNEGIQAAAKSMGQGVKGMETGGLEDSSAPIRPVEASVQERGIRISFDSRLLFAPGSATLKASGWKFLDTVAARLKKFDNNRIHVEGHTDSQPISTIIFPSNWELSGARASSVVRYFIDKHQFNPSSMVAVGYGSTQPLGSNDTPEGRSRNRRVDLILYSEKLSTLLNPRVQYLKEEPLSTKSHDPDKPKEVLPVLPAEDKPGEKYQDGPVKVIIKEKDGTEKVLIPKTKASTTDKTSHGAPELVKSEEHPASVKPSTHAFRLKTRYPHASSLISPLIMFRA
jgi:chemotaxis protein MotB